MLKMDMLRSMVVTFLASTACLHQGCLKNAQQGVSGRYGTLNGINVATQAIDNGLIKQWPHIDTSALLSEKPACVNSISVHSISQTMH